MMRPLAAVLAIVLFTASVEAADRYLVATRSEAREAPLRILRDAGEFQSHAVRAFRSVNAFAANLTADEVAELKRSADVRYVSPVVERHASVDGRLPRIANGSAFATAQTIPYGVTMVRAPELWELTKGAGPINVAILDTGIDATHPDLAANYAGGYNTYRHPAAPTDDNGHGTHVAGIIAALDNDIGVVGVAPEARLWSAKVLDRTGFGTDENVIAGLEWVIDKKHEVGGDWIVNLSLGAPDPSPVEKEVFQRVIAEGILVSAAAGNRGEASVQYPAGYDGVIAVGAVDAKNNLASFSDHGPHLSVVAPGVRVLSTARVGTVPIAGLTLTNGTGFDAAAVEGSGRGEINGRYVLCGSGNAEDFPAQVRGAIALIRRGDITFNQKVRNAEAAGAVAVVIYNNNDVSDYNGWTLLRPNCASISGCDDTTRRWPVVVAIGVADGQRLVSDPAQTIDVGSWIDDYKFLSGTSQAAPHVAGALALVWSLAPAASADRVKEALLSTTADLGPAGFDLTFGYGLIDVVAAAKKIAPRRFAPHIVPAAPNPLRAIP